MSDILDPTEQPIGVVFIPSPPGCILKYTIGGSGGIALTRAEMMALYSRIQDIMAAELTAAGWEEAQADYGRWFYRPPVEPIMTSFPIDAAWAVMQEAQNAD